MKAKWILPLMVATAAASGPALAGDTAVAGESGATVNYPGPKRSVFNRSPLDHGDAGSMAGHAAAGTVEYAGPRRSAFNRSSRDHGADDNAVTRIAGFEYLGPKRSVFRRNPNADSNQAEFAPFEEGASRRY